MSFIKEYAEKLVTAEEAVKVVKSGDWLDYGWCSATARELDKALAAHVVENDLVDLKIRGGILMWVPEIFKIENPADHITWNSWHMSGVERKAIAQGFAYYTPIRYSEMPRYYRDSKQDVDVAMFQVAPMDDHGYFNFGPNASHMMAMCERAKTIIVEVNKNMPRCLGGFEEAIHISQVDKIIEGPNYLMAELGAGGPATEVDKRVAHASSLVSGECQTLSGHSSLNPT